MKIPILTILLVLFFCSCDEIRRLDPSYERESKIKFENNNYDFGIILEGSIVYHTFKFTNKGSESFRINSIKIPENYDLEKKVDFVWDRKSIKPEEWGQIKMKFNSDDLTNKNVNEHIEISFHGDVRFNTELQIKGLVKPTSLRERTVLALETAEESFDAFKKITDTLSNDIILVRDQINSKFDEINDAKITPMRKALKISNEIDSSICTIYAKRISDLRFKFNNIEDSSKDYLKKLNSLLYKIENSSNLHRQMSRIVEQVRRDHEVAKKRAINSIARAEEKYIEMCNYKEAIIIMSTVRALREKIDEFLLVADEANKIITELNNFAKDGKAIISQPINNI